MIVQRLAQFNARTFVRNSSATAIRTHCSTITECRTEALIEDGPFSPLSRTLVPRVSSPSAPSLFPPSCLCQTVSFFSTNATPLRKDALSILDQAVDEDGLVKKPSNLIFDVKSTVSPFRGMDKVEVEYINENDEEFPTEDLAQSEVIGATTTVQKESEDDDYDDNEIEEWFDAKTRPEPKQAIPLPERLHVDVHQFYDPFTNDEAEEGAVRDSTKPITKVGTIHLSSQVFGCDPIRTDILQRVVQYQRNKKRGKRFPAKTKTISEVAGSGRKVRQQKGGGQARAGHRRPAHWRGGAKAHGPKGVLQDYTTKLNKKVRKMGVRMALSQKLYEQNLIVVDELAVPTHKTAFLDHLLYDRFGISGKRGTSAVILDDAYNPIDSSEILIPIKEEEGSKPSREEDSTYEQSNEQEGKLPLSDKQSKTGPDSSESMVLHGVNANLKVASGNLDKVLLSNQSDASVWEMLRHEKLVLSLSAIRSLEKRLTT